MFKRKLSALNYPNADSFDASNQTEFRGLVLWLEVIAILKETPISENALLYFS